MNVDLDVIAQRGRCEVSSLRLALPLIEQGYTPPFLARYRRDELGGLDEASLWALSHAVRSQNRLEEYRNDLHAAWQATRLQDPAIGRAVSNAKSRRLLDRLGRRIKSESNESAGALNQLVVRILNPKKGDSGDIEELAASIATSVTTFTANPAEPDSNAASATENVPAEAAHANEAPADPTASTPESNASAPAAVDLSKLDETLAKRLIGDPRVIGAAVRWLSKHSKIHIIEVVDPHGNSDAESEKPAKPIASEKKEAAKTQESATETPAETPAEAAAPQASEADTADTTVAEAEPTAETPAAEVSAEAPQSETTTAEASVGPTTAESPVAGDTTAETAGDISREEAAKVAETPAAETTAETAASQTPAPETPAAEVTNDGTSAEVAVAPAAAIAPEANVAPAKGKASKKEKQAAKAPSAKAAKKNKKISPRQRRRRWLVSTLKPLAGKRMPSAKLSSFQIVMLGRALRSQVAQCAFDYDATRLVAELQKTVLGFNRLLGEHLAQVLVANEAAIRDAAEGAWWDEIQEQASARLVSIAAENLNRQINRGGVDAKVVMSIDAIGPRTAATAIVSSDGRLLHNEDIPCQLSASMRTLAVTKMGELIHKYHVDLIVISNGPARRACMVAVGELIKQSGEQSVRWTLADRSGADAYAGSPAGDQEMKQTPRRFRSAAWIAFSTLQPSQAMVKVDPLKLRLGSFQRELSDQAVLSALEDVLISGAARGGVDVNSTTAAWLERLPGMDHDTAGKLDKARRESLIASREDLLARGPWSSEVHQRQALPFLRVFESEETLDGTLIHPDDYALAKRLATALEVELPPASPPGYTLPDYQEKPAKVESPKEEIPVAEEAATTPESATPASDDSDAPASEQPEVAPEQSARETASLEGAAETATETPDSAPEAVAAEVAEPAATVSEESTASEDTSTADETVSADSTETASETTTDDAASTDEASAPEAAAETAAKPPAEPVHEVVRRPKPEKAKVDKLIKEWQVGVRRSYQIVNWLCEPFGEGILSGESPAVMTSMPVMNELKQGDQVIGVVVGVMPFGVFVELSPECSGLIHVSRISDGYVEDLHEAVQVGDVVTAWVTGIDGKRRRVGLSAISPEREAEVQANRRESGPGRGGRDSDRRGGQRSGGQRGGQAGAAASGQGQSNQGQGNRGQGNRGQGSGPPSRGGDGAKRGSGGNRGGGNRGGGRDGGRRDSRGGSRGPRRPEVYEVVGKEPDSPTLTDAMQEGKEPLRSFGDLMQLFTKEKEPAKKPKQNKPDAEPVPATESPVTESPAAESPATETTDAAPSPAPADEPQSIAPQSTADNTPPASDESKPTTGEPSS